MNTIPQLPATKPQINTIHLLRRNLPELDDATYRQMLREVSDGAADSATKLTRRQATAVITHLNGKGFRVIPKRNPPATKPAPRQARVTALITPNQRALINHLVNEIAWRTPDGYQRWLSAKMKLQVVATRQQASRVIEGLKGLKEHGHAALPTQ